MKQSIWFQFFLVSLVNAIARTNYFTEDYCWRDFEGIIPFDALIMGQDVHGKAIYLGQVLHEDNLVPGKIYENDNNIYYEWFTKEYITNQNVKIFCTQQSQKFQWLTARAETILGLTSKILVKGGYQKDFLTYVARGIIPEGETSVGKVVCRTDGCFGMYATYSGTQREVKNFQILTYNPRIASRNPQGVVVYPQIGNRNPDFDSITPSTLQPALNETVVETKCTQKKVVINVYY